jgi:uncharacterized protein (DUF952 family)
MFDIRPKMDQEEHRWRLLKQNELFPHFAGESTFREMVATEFPITTDLSVDLPEENLPTQLSG